MTVVNHNTGEIVEMLDKAAARRLTDRIRLLAETVAEQVEKMAGLIDEARTGSAWLALGYASWPAYVSKEFGGVLPRLDREPRQAFVRELSARGMSTRAIAPVVGVGDSTVQRDLAGAPSGAARPNPNAQAEAQARITAREDAARQRAYCGLDSIATLDPQDEDNGEAPATPEVPEPHPAVTGLDGKVYPFAKPKSKPKPVVLTDSAADYDNAEKASKSLSNAIAKLLEFQYPNMRVAMTRHWSMASKEVPPTPRRDVTPEQMRVAAQGLLDLADEWSTT